jgi:Gas vesicle protein K
VLDGVACTRLEPEAAMSASPLLSLESDADAAQNLSRLTKAASALDLDPDNAENGLAKLVLTVIELLRQLCERQAVRRMEGGSLSDEEVERLGEAFLRLEAKMEELKTLFGIEAEDLNLDLGPLGRLL